MRTRDRLGLCATVALELGPDAGEGRERPIVIEREPDDVFLVGLRVRLGRVFGEAVEGYEAAVFRLQPASPIGGRLPTYRLITRSRARMAFWFVVIE